MGLFDLEKHFAFYGAYHSNPINVIIHILFVWPIFFTALLLFYFTPPMVNVTIPFPDTLYLNFGFFFALVYAGFYVIMDLKAGFLAAFLCFLCWVGSSFLGHGLGYSLSWKEQPHTGTACFHRGYGQLEESMLMPVPSTKGLGLSHRIVARFGKKNALVPSSVHCPYSTLTHYQWDKLIIKAS